MPQESFPGNGHDGEEPLPGPEDDSCGAGSGPAAGHHGAPQPQPGDEPGNMAEGPGEDAYLDWLAAEVDAGRIEIPGDGQPAQGLTIHLAEVTDPAAADLAGFTKGGPADMMDPGAALAALAEAACAAGTLPRLSDNQLLGVAGAARRLAGLAAWLELSAASEFAARRATGDTAAQVAGETLSEFAGDELAPELKMTPFAAAEHLAYSRTVIRRLPATLAALHVGAIDGYRVKIISEATQWLSDADAAEADQILAVSATQLTYGRLRNAAARLVMMLDPDAAKRRKEEASKNARVSFFGEEAGTAGLSGRDLPVTEAFASWANVKARALSYRAAGIPGTITELRARALLDLLQEKDTRDTLAETPGAEGKGAEHAASTGETTGTGNPADDDEDLVGEGDPVGMDDTVGTDASEPDEDRAGPSGAARTPGRPPVAALINITVPLATLLNQSAAPGEAAGFGLLDPDAACDLAATASRNPATRWCVTVVGLDGTAVAHGCAPGQHPYDPGQYETGGGRSGGGNRDGPASSRGGPSGPQETGRAAEFFRRLNAQLTPIAKEDCDHASYEPGYRPSRKLKHIIRARTVRCHFFGCARPAAECDADHTVPWPSGPTCQCKLGPPCRHHHRCKQDPGRTLTQAEPGVMAWTGPSGRGHVTRPTVYPA